MHKYDTFWRSNPDWWYFKNGIFALRDDAPEEAKISYENYMKQKGMTKETLQEILNAKSIDIVYD